MGINEDVDFEAIKEKWQDILAVIKKKKIALHALMIEGEPLSFRNTILTIGFKDGFAFHRDALNKEDNKASIEEIIEGNLNTRIELKLVMEGNPVLDESQEKEDLVKDVIDVFGEDLVEVED